MKQSNLIVIYAALINVMLIASIPRYFSDNQTSTVITDTRFLSIIESKRKGIPLTASDLRYEKTQIKASFAEHYEKKQKLFIGTLKSFLMVSAVCITTLIILSYKSYLGSAASFVYFLIPSMLIFIIVPVSSWILFLMILLNMLVICTIKNLLKAMTQSKRP